MRIKNYFLFSILLLSFVACTQEEPEGTPEDRVVREYQPYLPGDPNYQDIRDGGLPCSDNFSETPASCEGGKATCLIEYRASEVGSTPEEVGKCVEYESGKYQPFPLGDGNFCATSDTTSAGLPDAVCNLNDRCEVEQDLLNADNPILGVCRPNSQ